MAAPITYDHKRGDTLSRAAILPAGTLPLGDWSARCSLVEQFTNKVHPLVATVVPVAGPDVRYALTLYAPASEVEQWRVGKLFGDIEFIDASATPEPFKVSSATFIINLKSDVTK